VKEVIKDEDIEALRGLNLTALQAKVYLTLATLKEAKMSVISKNVRVARQDLYRVMADLEKLGLVEKVIAKPIRHKALPIVEGVPILLEKLYEENHETHEKAIQLIDRHRYKKRMSEYEEDEIQLLLIPERQALLSKLKKEILTAQRSIDIVTSAKKLERALFDLAPSLREQLDKKVMVRWITDKPRNPKAWSIIAKTPLESSFFQLRYVSHDPNQAIAIFDEKEAIIATNANLDYIQTSALFTNAIPLVTLAQNFFDMLWKKPLKSNSELWKRNSAKENRKLKK
jgi:sugar-specific transcriptional regulator TrmB